MLFFQFKRIALRSHVKNQRKVNVLHSRSLCCHATLLVARSLEWRFANSLCKGSLLWGKGLRVDIHCHINFTCVNKKEAMYNGIASKRKSRARFNFYAHARPFIHCLYYIYTGKFHARNARNNYATVESTLKIAWRREGEQRKWGRLQHKEPLIVRLLEDWGG